MTVALCAADDKKKNPAMGNPEAIEAGRKQFLAACSGCHGQNGQGGRGPNIAGRGMWHQLDDDGLFRVIQKGVPGADMPGFGHLPEEKLWQLAAYVRSVNAPAFEAPVPGNVEAGRAVFWEKGGCSGCHSIRGQGGKIGPDLSNIGASKPLEQIREDIVDPSADGYEAYRKVTLIRTNGGRLEGYLRNRTNFSIQMLDAGGNLHLVRTDELREIILAKPSPMPKDYQTRLSKQELDDLLAYLSRQSLRPADAKQEGK